MKLRTLSETSGVKFGTSGARGLVAHMTDRVCYGYTRGFLQQQGAHKRVAIAGGLLGFESRADGRGWRPFCVEFRSAPRNLYSASTR